MSTRRLKEIARDCLAALARKTSMIRVKIALRDVVRDEPDYADTFALLFRETHVSAFEAYLNHVAEHGVAPKERIRPKDPPSMSAAERRGFDKLVEAVRDRVDYDPLTGALTWRTDGYGRVKGEHVGADNGKGTLQIAIQGQRLTASYVCWLHYYGEPPAGRIRIRRNSKTLAIKNLYVLRDSR